MSTPIFPIQQPASIAAAAAILRDGELVAIPTETVYGIAAAPRLQASELLLHRFYDADSWPALPLLLAPEVPLAHLAHSNQWAERLRNYFWPGPLTVLLPAIADFPFALPTPCVAKRVPDYAPLWPLLRALGGVLIVGRAAHTGYPPAITAQEVAEQLADDVALILDGGRALFGLPSTVVDCIVSPPRIVQRGIISAPEIMAALQRPAERN